MPNEHMSSSSQSKNLGSTLWCMASGYIIVACRWYDVLKKVPHNNYTGKMYG